MKLLFLIAALIFSLNSYAGLSLSIDNGDNNLIDLSLQSGGQKTISLTLSASGGDQNIYREIRPPQGISGGNVASNCSGILSDGQTCSISLTFTSAELAAQSSGNLSIKYEDESGSKKILNQLFKYSTHQDYKLVATFGAPNNVLTFEPISALSNSKKRIRIVNTGSSPTPRLGKMYNQLPKGLSLISDSCAFKELQPQEACYVKIGLDSSTLFSDGPKSSVVKWYTEPDGEEAFSLSVSYEISLDSLSNVFADLSLNKVDLISADACYQGNNKNFSCFYTPMVSSSSIELLDSQVYCDGNGLCYNSLIYGMNTAPIRFPINLIFPDKAYIIGQNVLENGDFSNPSNVDGWYSTNTPVISGGSLVTSSPGHGYDVLASVPTEVGVEYEVSLTVTANSSGALPFPTYGLIPTGFSASKQPNTFVGTLVGTFTATGINQTVGFHLQAQSGSVQVGNVSIKPLPGNNAAKDSVLSNFISIDKSDVALDNIYIYEDNIIDIPISNLTSLEGEDLDLLNLIKVSSPDAEIKIMGSTCLAEVLGASSSCSLKVSIRPNRYVSGNPSYTLNLNYGDKSDVILINAQNVVKREGVFDEDFFGKALFSE